MFDKLYSTVYSQIWPTVADFDYIEHVEEKSLHVALKKAKEWPDVPTRQFAMRFLGAHIDNTSLEGSFSQMSADYWCDLLDLWLNNEGVFFPFRIKREILQELRAILEAYGKLCDLVVCSKEDPSSVAQKLLAAVHDQLQARGYAYLCLGYKEGGGQQGHAIPARLEYHAQKKQLVIFFLNLGEGVEKNPELPWNGNYPRHHFRSFSVTLSEDQFFGATGLDLISRQVTLMTQSPIGYATPYSATDVYCPFYLLGEANAEFFSNLNARSKKPQTSPKCADEAVELLIRDFLIEKTVAKEETKRFFSNEKLCTLLRFYHAAQSANTLEQWLMLRKATQEYALTLLKKGEQSFLEEAEVLFGKEAIDFLIEESLAGEQNAPQPSCPSFPISDIPSDWQTFLPFNTGEEQSEIASFFFPEPHLFTFSPQTYPPATKLLEWTLSLNKTVMDLAKKGQYARAFNFFERALSQLPVPNASNEDYWDGVPLSDQVSFLDAACQGLYHSCEHSLLDSFTYKKNILLHHLLTIADKLIRKQLPQLDGYSPPFFPASGVFPKDQCQYPQLPMGDDNRRWDRICIYFKEIAQVHPRVLFAFHKRCSINEGYKELTRNPATQDPVATHLRFLSSFLEPSDHLRIVEQYAQIWENRDCKYLPYAFHLYQYLAQMSWRRFASQNIRLPAPSLPLCTKQQKINEIEIAYAGIELHYFNLKNLQHTVAVTATLPKCKGAKGIAKTENQAVCLASVHEETQMPLPLLRDWARIAIYPSLQIDSTVLWIRDHLQHIKNPVVKNQIEQMIFAPGQLLIRRIRESPALLLSLLQSCDEGMKHYGKHPKDLPEFLFFIRLHICIASHYKEQIGSLETLRLQTIEKCLLEKIKEISDKNALSSLYQHLRFLYSITLPRESFSAKELLKAGFWLRYHREEKQKKDAGLISPYWMIQEIAHLEDFWIDHITFYQKEQNWIDSTCREIFHTLFPSLSIPQGPWERERKSFFTAGEYSICLSDNIVLRNQEECLWLLDPHVLTYELEFQLAGELLSTFSDEYSLQWIGRQETTIEIGEYRISLRRVGIQIIVCLYKQITTSSGKHWYQRVSTKGLFFDDESQSDVYRLWERTDQKGKWIAVCQVTDKPLFEIIQKENTLEIQKIGPEGEIQPLKLLNINKASDQVKNFFKRLDLQGYGKKFCWVDTEGRIALLELGSPFNWQFKGILHQGVWRLQCVQETDLFLSWEHTVPSLRHFNGALVLENELGQAKKIAIPFYDFESNAADFLIDICLGSPIFDIKMKKKFFCYHLDETTGWLLHDEPEANLFLSLLFGALRDYKSALHYLQQGNAYSYFSDFYFIKHFVSLKDRSPEALAFYLRVGLHFFRNATQLVYKGYGTQGQRQGVEFYGWINKTYNSYLRYVSSTHGHVPAYIRLSYQEELCLLEELEKAGEPSYAIFGLRKQLLENNEVSQNLGNSVYHLVPKALYEISTLDLAAHFDQSHNALPQICWDKPIMPEHFVRASWLSIEGAFGFFFERAKKGQATLDIFYLQRSANDQTRWSDRDVLAYTLLLQIVQLHPKEFELFKFTDNIFSNTEIFLKIVQKASELQKGSCAQKIAAFFKKDLFFSYPSTTLLSLPASQKLSSISWQFPPQFAEQALSFHCSLQKDFLENWCQIEKIPFIKTPRKSLFESIRHTTKSPALKKLLDLFDTGFKACLDGEKGSDCFTLKDGCTQEGCLAAAERLYSDKKEALEQLKKEAERLANYSPPSLYFNSLKQAATLLPRITIEGILTQALEKKDPNHLRTANPALAPTTIQQLMIMTINYHILNCHVIQLTKAIRILKSQKDIQAFGEALAVYGAFDPTQEPGLLIFQSRTQLIAWKEQGDFIRWIQHQFQDNEPGKILLCELDAGKGKSTFVSPILADKAHQEGLMPVSISTPSLYQVERQRQRVALKRAYQLNLEVLELALNTEATAKDFEWIYSTLLSYSEDGVLKIIPETYFALYLKHKLALEIGDVEQVRYLSLILHFFKEKCVGLIDEGRINLSSFVEAKLGIGEKKSLPADECSLFLLFYKTLSDPKNKLNDGRQISDAIQLFTNHQAETPASDREAVREFLISFIVKHPFLNIPLKEQKGIEAWWKSADYAQPAWLMKEMKRGTAQARLILLAAQYFHSFYDFAIESVGQMSHKQSRQHKEEIYIPARNRGASRGYYVEPYSALILTIQGTLQTGLSLDQCAKLIDLLQEVRSMELAVNTEALIEKKFKKWTCGAFPSLLDVSSQNTEHVAQLHRLLGHKPEAILWYLEQGVLSQIVFSTRYFNATPQHFLHAFRTTFVYSAFLGPLEIYGMAPSLLPRQDSIRLNTTFGARVVYELMTEKNGEIIQFDHFKTPQDFFEQLWKLYPTLFHNLRVLNDVGGMLRDFSNKEIAQGFFAFLKCHEDELHYDGVLLFEDTMQAEDENNLQIWLHGSEDPKMLPEGEVVSGLATLGYKWHELKLLTLIDPSHAAGTDILQMGEATALTLVAEHLAIGDSIQGVMRMRNFFKDQKIVWGIFKNQAKQIENELQIPFTVEALLFWQFINESKKQEKEIALSAEQQISYLLEQSAHQALDKYLDQPEQQIVIWKKVRGGFVKTFEADPIKRFTKNAGKPGAQLKRQVKESYAQFNYHIPWEKAVGLKEDIKQTMRTLKYCLPAISCKHFQDLSREAMQHCEQELKKVQEKVDYSEIVPEILPALSPQLHIYHPSFCSFLQSGKFSTTARQLFQTQELTEQLFFSHRLIKTAKKSGVSLNQEYLKAAQYFLLICEREELIVVAISDQEATFFQEQLIMGTRWLQKHKQQIKSCPDRHVALFTADGRLAQNGPKSLGFSDKELTDLASLEWFQEAIIDMGLISCRLRKKPFLDKRLKKWSNLPEFWKKIKSCQANPETAQVYMIDRYIAALPQKKASFFSFFK